MLHKEVLETKTFELLKELMKDRYLQSFNLVGGTALSLYMGHRISIDLDLFSKKKFNVQKLRKHLNDKYGFTESFSEEQTLKGLIDGVFIDCINYDYPLISPVTNYEGIRITGIPDLLAMKLAAIADSGNREKDFVDVAFFSTKYSLNSMLDCYERKYPGVNKFVALKALVYYDDIDGDQPLILANGDYNFSQIKKRLEDMVKEPDRIFDSLPVRQNTQIEELLQEVSENGISYIKGEKGIAWLRESSGKLYNEAETQLGLEDNSLKNYKDYFNRRIVTVCSTLLDKKQIEFFKATLSELKDNVNNRNSIKY